ncbi:MULTISPECIES: hypothetical protein [Paraburkholderia]|jgi:hypothetical protein|uniref:hypothetical protein n=1 Tax=Paraburkholderia TaxID=1822464 RepID=UPI0012603CDF|nr:hypothetical protein [Paraburkholderia terricola]
MTGDGIRREKKMLSMAGTRAHHRRQRRSQTALIVAGIRTTITEVAADAPMPLILSASLTPAAHGWLPARRPSA